MNELQNCDAVEARLSLHDQNLTFVVLLPSHHRAAVALPGVGTFRLRRCFSLPTDTDLFEQVFQYCLVARKVIEVGTTGISEPRGIAEMAVARIGLR